MAGVSHWYRSSLQADGQSITLYEHKAGSTQHHGDPIADVYAVVARPNSCIIVVADGVNWGIKPRLAARCAVHGSVDHLNSKLFNCPKVPTTTQDVFHIILRSFHSAQTMIIEHGGTTTTLCVAVVVELNDSKAGSKWGLCVVSVGDSLCYVWRSEDQEVFEVTSDMHLGLERNPRDCGGCLGCDLGDRPDLSNLTCSFVPLSKDDIVFVMSDGIVDNLDPVLLKTAISISQQSTPTTPSVTSPPFPPPSNTAPAQGTDEVDHSPSHPQRQGLHVAAPSTPVVNPEQRQHLLLMNLTRVLREKVASVERKLNATDVKEALINHAIEVTDEKRHYLEQCWNALEKPDLTASEKRANDRKISQHIKQLPGKLDHATIAAYCVGKLLLTEEIQNRTEHTPTNSYAMNNVVESSSTGSMGGGLRKAKSFSAGGSVFYSLASQPGTEEEGGGGSGAGAGVHRGEPPNSSIANNKWVIVNKNKSNSFKRDMFVRHHSDSSSIRIKRQDAIVSFPVCVDSPTESYENIV